jgi:hypothetical protein
MAYLWMGQITRIRPQGRILTRIGDTSLPSDTTTAPYGDTGSVR